MPPPAPTSSLGADYADRLARLSGAWWKRWVPNPYRWHIRFVCRGQVLDVGCGIGRALGYLGDRAVGVDPNEDAVAIARRRGHTAFTPTTLPPARRQRTYDCLLCSHVLEHLSRAEAEALLTDWLPLIRANGRIVLICPQERGYASDPSHVRFLDGAGLRELCASVGLATTTTRSFPLPRPVGRFWSWNETVVVARVTDPVALPTAG